jgi:hypothetical protein
MKKIIFTFICFLALISCTKTPLKPNKPVEQYPSMLYKNLGDTGIVFGRSASFDIDDDGSKDIYFTTLLVGDPINKQDKKQWHIQSSFDANLPVSVDESIPMLNNQDNIPIHDFSGYSWYNASGILLVQKVLSDTQPPFWEGQWKAAQNQFVPIQIIRNGKPYNGWIEISFSMSEEKVVIHRSGISKQANQTVKAGK